jgi:hypothetical protein
MKRTLFLLSAIVLMTSFSFVSYPKMASSGAETIKVSVLESHLSFLASPLLKGRLNGSDDQSKEMVTIANNSRSFSEAGSHSHSFFSSPGC